MELIKTMAVKYLSQSALDCAPPSSPIYEAVKQHELVAAQESLPIMVARGAAVLEHTSQRALARCCICCSDINREVDRNM